MQVQSQISQLSDDTELYSFLSESEYQDYHA